MEKESQEFYNNSIFWVELDRISPNPYQPRKEFDEARLRELSESIRQYGVLQPLVVTRHEEQREDGGLLVKYELIAGERRLRASKLAGLSQVPVIIRSGEETGKVKLELAIIENLQREDLNPIDRAKAFQRLVEEFNYKHAEVATKVGRSREYVSNTIRLLLMPEDMQQALADGKISEGHTRPLLMLASRPDEQNTLFKEILYKKLTVRESEGIARRIAVERSRKKKDLTPHMIELEKEPTDTLGTRVQIEQKEVGGKVVIDYFSPEDLAGIIAHFKEGANETESGKRFLEQIASRGGQLGMASSNEVSAMQSEETTVQEPVDDRSKEEIEEDDNEDLYSVKNFSI